LDEDDHKVVREMADAMDISVACWVNLRCRTSRNGTETRKDCNCRIRTT